MDHPYRENGARNIYSNYNQTGAYVECSPNQSKNYILSTFPSSNRRNFEKSGNALAVSVSEFYQSIAVQLYQAKLIRRLSLVYVYQMCINMYICTPPVCCTDIMQGDVIIQAILSRKSMKKIAVTDEKIFRVYKAFDRER